MKHDDPLVGSSNDWHRLADDLGITLDDAQIEQLQEYGRWLASEAEGAGGIGPEEPGRLFDRHLADSLTFLAGIPDDAAIVIDVGSGVGLPGIPLAIARPDLSVRLIDRSDRRTWLARRACRVLDLDVEIQTATIEDIRADVDVLTFRASLPLAAAADALGSGRSGASVAIYGWSRRSTEPDMPEPPPGVTFERLRVVSTVLDSPSWLLRMRVTELSI